MLFGQGVHGPVHLIDVVRGKVVGYAQAHHRCDGRRAHGRDIRQVHGKRGVSDIGGGVRGPAHVHAVDHHVEGQHGAVVEHRGVVTDSDAHAPAHARPRSDEADQLKLAVHGPTVPAVQRRLGYSPPPMIDESTVNHVARLARLRLTPDEQQVMREELSGILEHIDAIRAMDLDGVEPTTHVIAVENVLRPDEPRPGLSRDDALREAADVVDGSFGVPRMD